MIFFKYKSELKILKTKELKQKIHMELAVHYQVLLQLSLHVEKL